MREFLLELYLKHGEREFVWEWTDLFNGKIIKPMEEKFVEYKGTGVLPIYKLTPKAIEYLKNLDNP